MDVIENNNIKYSDEIRIVDGAITYLYGNLTDDAKPADLKNNIVRSPEIMFHYDDITVALNGTLNQSASVFHLDIASQYKCNVFYEWSYKGKIIAYSYTIPVSWDLEKSEIIPEKGENILTFSIKIGNINEGKVIAKKDFYFEVTNDVTDNSLSDAINALPNKYDYGNLSSYSLNRKSTCQLKNTNVLLQDNTFAVLNTKDNESIAIKTYKSIKDKTISKDYNLIQGNVEITHNDKTSYYVIDKYDYYSSYLSFKTECSGEKICVTNIEGRKILKDGVDISDNQAELERLASYFVAFLYGDEKTGITYIDDYTNCNNSTFEYLFKDYKSGTYSIDGSVQIKRL